MQKDSLMPTPLAKSTTLTESGKHAPSSDIGERISLELPLVDASPPLLVTASLMLLAKEVTCSVIDARSCAVGTFHWQVAILSQSALASAAVHFKVSAACTEVNKQIVCFPVLYHTDIRQIAT